MIDEDDEFLYLEVDCVLGHVHLHGYLSIQNYFDFFRLGYENCLRDIAKQL